MPRFVILEHDHPHLHWDLMLEVGSALRTWRLPRAPHAGDCLAAEPLGDHRLLYLDYEGPVGGGRGVVRRWDGGTYEQIEGGEIGRERVILQMAGQKVQGRLEMFPGEHSAIFIGFSSGG